MAQVPVLTGEHLRVVPDFRGEAELLPEFLSIAEKLVNYFYNPNDVGCFQNVWLMSSLKSKIIGDAKINITSFNITTWQDLKTALLTTYSDKRDAYTYTLTIEMCNLTQGSDSPFEFLNKIQQLVNLHNSYLETHNLDQANLRQYINKLALRTLLKGLKDPLGSLMRTKDPQNLGEALNMLTNDFQIDVNKKTPNNDNHIAHKPKFTSPTHRPFAPFRPNPQPFRPNYFNPNRSFNSTPNRFPQRNPFNNNNQNYQNRPSTSGFQNTQQRFLPRPTPMSGVQTIQQNLHNTEPGSIPEQHTHEFATHYAYYDEQTNTYHEYEGQDTDQYTVQQEESEDFHANASENPQPQC